VLLLTDNPVVDASADRFGFRDHAQILCDAILATSDLPITVGVYGAWGSGKSSFINLCSEIFAIKGIPTVKFNPWKYDRRDEVWHALIQTVLDEIAVRLESEISVAPSRREQIERTLERVAKLSKTAAWLVTRNAIGLFSKGFLTAADADTLLTEWQGSESGTYRHVNHFEADFRQVIDEYTGGGRLVVLIDDLDRCTPVAAVTVLDSLKLFLGEASCVFVLAMDYQMISEAVAAQLGEKTARGRQYLEKLIQFPYHLPAVRFESLYQNLHREVVGLKSDPALWELIETAFGANPRRVRRFINAYNLSIATLRLHSEPTRTRQMHVAILLALRFQHPDFFAAMQETPLLIESIFREDGKLSHDYLYSSGDPELERLLKAIHPGRSDFNFPQPPKPEDIRLLTDSLTLAVETLPASSSEG
jgi:KAP family P-loop domain